jgi:hypothetical protein
MTDYPSQDNTACRELVRELLAVQARIPHLTKLNQNPSLMVVRTPPSSLPPSRLSVLCMSIPHFRIPQPSWSSGLVCHLRAVKRKFGRWHLPQQARTATHSSGPSLCRLEMELQHSTAPLPHAREAVATSHVVSKLLFARHGGSRRLPSAAALSHPGEERKPLSCPPRPGSHPWWAQVPSDQVYPVRLKPPKRRACSIAYPDRPVVCAASRRALGA